MVSEKIVIFRFTVFLAYITRLYRNFYVQGVTSDVTPPLGDIIERVKRCYARRNGGTAKTAYETYHLRSNLDMFDTSCDQVPLGSKHLLKYTLFLINSDPPLFPYK